jgi:phosphoribosyl 1,2-cyclic phosphodiesterase
MNDQNTEQKPIATQGVINFEFDDEPLLSSKDPMPANTSETKEETKQNKTIKYISLGSGSSGNSCYVGTDRGGVLIDAGIDANTTVIQLKANGIDIKDVKGILLTHDHHDHIRYVYKLLRTYKHMHLFCTNRVINGLLQRHNISKRIKDYHVPIYKEIPFSILDFEITAFDVPHDGSDNMGFSLQVDDRSFVLATDLGEVTARARHYMSQASYLVIESNYDRTMLRNGEYPEYLKARIMTGNGHMDNEDTAKFLAEIANPKLKYVFLCHLSADNNDAEIALRVNTEALRSKGLTVGGLDNTLADRKADVCIGVLPRFECTRLFMFRD